MSVPVSVQLRTYTDERMDLDTRMQPGPGILPPFVSSCAGTLAVDDHRQYFEAGRQCAAAAVRALRGGPLATPVGRGAAGEPLWPEGLTGSITHKDGFVWAAVARTADALSLGIDAERRIDDGCAGRISRVVALPQERDAGGSALAPALRIALLFSIKESVFKCLYPLVRRRFYYHALEVRDIDASDGTFRGVLLEPLSPEFDEGRVIDGRLAIDRQRVYTSVVLATERP